MSENNNRENSSASTSFESFHKNKKAKYATHFQDSWRQNPLYKSWLVKIDEFTAKCNICNIKFTVQHDGEKSLKTHLNSKGHSKTANTLSKNTLLTAFLPKKHSDEENYVTIIEVSQIYHAVNHHHSYLSTDCGIKLNSYVYRDSDLAKKVHCGRTKAEAIIANCLGPKSVERVLEEMGAGTPNSIAFSIMCDASNKGSQKLFPIAVRYFSLENGVVNKLLDFIENNDESSLSINNSILKTLEMFSLKASDISAYSADNASVNYGIHNSVYQKLSAENKGIVKANCNCHVIHNAGRNACKVLSFDVENLILKIYAEFSNSAKKTESLKECFDYLDIEYQKMIRHVTTRWLSLYAALERLIRCWPAVKKYFLELGEENCHKNIWSFFSSQEHEVDNDLKPDISFSECYVYFLHHYMHMLNVHIMKLESNYITSLELHNIMLDLKEQIESRLEDQFFGSKISMALGYLTPSQKQTFIKEATLVYQRTLNYLNQYYDFENSPFKYFECLNLKKNKSIEYQKILEAKNVIKVNIDEDRLYDEVLLLRKTLKTLQDNSVTLELGIDKIWCQIFENADMPQLTKIVIKILSIPVSNAYPERIFSLMKNLWTDERNRMSVALVKAELCTKLNFSMSCRQFAEYLEKREQNNLLKICQSNSKYKFQKRN